MYFKKRIFILLFWLPGLAWNSAHFVPVGKCGNCLQLIVVNPTPTRLEKICIVVNSAPEWIQFFPLSREIETLSPNENKRVSFSFNVTATEPALTGFIHFYVLDVCGQMLGTKSIQLTTIVPEEESNLGASYPNPANPSTTIPFVLTKEADVSLVIYNMLGQEVRTLFQGKKGPGHYEFYWDGKDKKGAFVPSGTYLVRLHVIDASRTQTFTRKVLIQK